MPRHLSRYLSKNSTFQDFLGSSQSFLPLRNHPHHLPKSSPNRFQLNRRIGDIARVETYLSRLKRAQELLLKHLLHENVQNI